MKVYTKTGDQGETGLRGGLRVPKNHARVEAYGQVDELNSFIGTAISAITQHPLEPLEESLSRIQEDLFHIGAILADPQAKTAALPESKTLALEKEIDRMSEELEPLKQFILPGGSLPGALLHLARTVCRRAERWVVALGPKQAPAEIVVYLNRLSDYLFTAARWVNHRLKHLETQWKGSQ